MRTVGRRRLAAPILAALCCFVLPLVAGAQTTARPEDVGLSSEMLARIGPAMQALVDSGRTAGVMTLVARKGEVVHWQATGWRLLGEERLEPDDIFRIYSMTKPVKSVATMMLVDEGKLSLDDPIGRHIPSLAERSVIERFDSDNGEFETRPAASDMTIRQLLSHSSGLVYPIFSDVFSAIGT